MIEPIVEVVKSVSPALIAAATALGVVLLKDSWMLRKQRRDFGRRLLMHFARQQVLMLRSVPAQQMLSVQMLEQYVDVYLATPADEEAFETISSTHCRWRTGAMLEASSKELAETRLALEQAMEYLQRKLH